MPGIVLAAGEREFQRSCCMVLEEGKESIKQYISQDLSKGQSTPRRAGSGHFRYVVLEGLGGDV